MTEVRSVYAVANDLVHRSEALRRRILPGGGISGRDGFWDELAYVRGLLDEIEEAANGCSFVAGPPAQEPARNSPEIAVAIPAPLQASVRAETISLGDGQSVVTFAETNEVAGIAAPSA